MDITGTCVSTKACVKLSAALYMHHANKLMGCVPRTDPTTPHNPAHIAVELQTLALGCCPRQKMRKEETLWTLESPVPPNSFLLSVPCCRLGFHITSPPIGEQVGESVLAWLGELFM